MVAVNLLHFNVQKDIDFVLIINYKCFNSKSLYNYNNPFRTNRNTHSFLFFQITKKANEFNVNAISVNNKPIFCLFKIKLSFIQAEIINTEIIPMPVNERINKI